MRTDTLALPRLASFILTMDMDVSPSQVRLHLKVPRPMLFTAELPGFDRRLLERLPSLWRTICHNDHGLSFADELRSTEMGHVIEHVVLALLAEQGLYVKGVTEWNWYEEPEGTFTITFYGDGLDPGLVVLAIGCALELIEPLLPLLSEDEPPLAKWRIPEPV